MLSFDQREALRQLREREYRFIQTSRKAYAHLSDRELWDNMFPPGTSEKYARDRYEEGRWVLKIVSGTWDQFFGYLRHIYEFSVWSSRDGYYLRRYRRNSYWYDRHGNPEFREGLGYRRQPHHQKKAKDESPRAAWRAHKKHKRDKSRHGRGYNLDHAGRWGKRMVHHANRSMVRSALHREDYDSISQGVQDIKRVWWD